MMEAWAGCCSVLQIFCSPAKQCFVLWRMETWGNNNPVRSKGISAPGPPATVRTFGDPVWLPPSADISFCCLNRVTPILLYCLQLWAYHPTLCYPCILSLSILIPFFPYCLLSISFHWNFPPAAFLFSQAPLCHLSILLVPPVASGRLCPAQTQLWGLCSCHKSLISQALWELRVGNCKLMAGWSNKSRDEVKFLFCLEHRLPIMS